MSKSRENVFTRKMHGKFGDQLVFRNRDGKSYVANIPKESTAPPGEGQQKIRNRFRLAATWAKIALANPVTREKYEARVTKSMSAYTLAMTDYLRPPVIFEMIVTRYKGHPGNTILVDATDDFNVKEVSVSITNPAGELIEEGPCLPPSEEMAYWQYTATVENTDLSGTVISAIATDDPGHTGQSSVTMD